MDQRLKSFVDQGCISGLQHHQITLTFQAENQLVRSYTVTVSTSAPLPDWA